MYLYEQPDWPCFRFDRARLTERLSTVRHQQGRIVGRMEGLGFLLQQDANLQALTEDVLKTSEIEGEVLDHSQVRSSLARQLGIDIGGLRPADRHVEGIVEMILDATRNYAAPLTAERLFGWQAALFPTGYSRLYPIQTGAWRQDVTGPMQVVSGAVGREHVHFEAPPAQRLDAEMAAFLDGFNAGPDIDPVLQAGLAHLWFVTLHPFEDGNGRIARAIGDMALARSELTGQRFYSLSAQIREERNDYYEILGRTQKGTLDVTAWMEWFLGCLGRALARSEATVTGVLTKSRLWTAVATVPLNERQRAVLARVIDGENKWEGKLTTSKWAKLAKCSQDTAHRDIISLVNQGILIRNPEGGRSTSYSIQPPGAAHSMSLRTGEHQETRGPEF